MISVQNRRNRFNLRGFSLGKIRLIPAIPIPETPFRPIIRSIEMLSRVCLTILVVLVTTGLSFGQSADNKTEGKVIDEQKLENPGTSNLEKPAAPDGPIAVISP